MAQPPLSQRIRRLERELGVQLFERSPRQVRLTAAGHELVRRARQVLSEVDGLMAMAADLAAGGGADDPDAPDAPVDPFGPVFVAAGVTGWLHAVDIDDPARQVSSGADETVALASVFKVPLLVALHRAVDAGRVQLDQPVRVGTERTGGPTGLGVMLDEAELSVRDLALLMVTISDNAAADAVLEQIGLDAVRTTVAELGLAGTNVVASSGALNAALTDDLLRSGRGLARALEDPSAVSAFRVFDPDVSNRSTPRDMTTLLSRIWRDEVASPEGCEEMRRLLRLQVCRHRLASGFPSRDVVVAAKSGTLLDLRSEIGVVELPDDGRYAVAVFTRSHRADPDGPAIDTTIGKVARMAVEQLGRPARPGRR